MVSPISPPAQNVPFVNQQGAPSISAFRFLQLVTNALNGSAVGNTTTQLVTLGNGLNIYVGSGSPNGVLAASPPSIYFNSAGGAGTTMWVKESGSGDTGWVGK